MKKNVVLELRGLDADLASVEAKIDQHLKDRANAEHDLARLKFIATRPSGKNSAENSHQAFSKSGPLAKT